MLNILKLLYLIGEEPPISQNLFASLLKLCFCQAKKIVKLMVKEKDIYTMDAFLVGLNFIF